MAEDKDTGRSGPMGADLGKAETLDERLVGHLELKHLRGGAHGVRS